jgi:glycosyltransferase involved in cell wall biosynthesis
MRRRTVAIIGDRDADKFRCWLIRDALAMRRPVITTDVSACRQTAIDGVNGFVVNGFVAPERDPASLAAAMPKLGRDPSLLSRMGRASRRIAEDVINVRHVNGVVMFGT